ncbi:hypothetical protein GCM10027290_26880 [Micromonospora sonneratiae]|uniref:Uncharacterized protein n=1 Tax=Micromonospora sonneratiae TaxID=1184706 RepID=A0ABW3YBA4_9ACTN
MHPPNIGRILAAHGDIFVVGSLLWDAVVPFRPDRWGLIGAGICLTGAGIIKYAPRSGRPLHGAQRGAGPAGGYPCRSMVTGASSASR